MSDLRICFAGTPEFAAGHLQALLDARFNIVAVYTQPDRPTGRGKKLAPSPVKALALSHDLPVLQPPTLRDTSAQQELASFNPDVLIVVAYGLILPAEILTIPRLGCLNVHASLLPRWRGAAPIERAIMAGDSETGITIMQMDAGLDTGDMLNRQAVSIEESDTGPSLEARLLAAGKESLTATLNDLEALQGKATPQDDALSTYAAKLDKSEALIDWQQSSDFLARQIRACSGRMPAYTLFGAERVRLLEARSVEIDNTVSNLSPGTIIDNAGDSFSVSCGTGQLQVSRLQLPGKKPVSVRDLLNSQPQLIAPGTSLGAPD